MYTKNVRFHLHGISLFVRNSQVWCASGQHIRVYDANGKVIKMIDSKTKKSVRCIILVKGTTDQVWSGCTDNKIYVYDAETSDLIKVLQFCLYSSQVLQVLKGHNAGVKCMLTVGNNNVWSASADGCVCIWDTTSPIKLIKQIQCHTRSINAMCQVGNQVWTASDDKQIRVTSM